MTTPLIWARSLPEANDEIIRLDSRSAVVSIGEPGAPTPYGFKEQHPLHLRLEFHDIIDEEFASATELVTPSREHVQTLLEHAKVLRTARLVYCHCNAGISRSTATAFILRCLWYGPGREAEALADVIADRPIAEPNPILVRFADEEMERGGAMLDALG